MPEHSLYGDLARYYDLLYHWKDYRGEVETLVSLIEKYKRSAGPDLLDVACGTGRHLEYLKQSFRCVGLDINSGILREARKRHPDIRFLQADMTRLRFRQRFDVITCLFSSIGYAKSYARLKGTIAGFAAHLKPGGIAIIEGWLESHLYKAGKIGMRTYDSPELKIVRMDVGTRKSNRSILDMHYLVAEINKGVRHFVERHELGLFEREKFAGSIKAAGLDAIVIKNGLMQDRNLYLGIKPL